MKVLHVVHGYLPESAGGIESYLERLLPVQRAAGLDVRLLAGSLEPRARCSVERFTHAGVPVVRLHRDDLFFDWHAKAWHPGVEALVAEVLAEEAPDVVHVHHWIRLTANLVELVQAAGRPAVVTLHDVYTTCPRAFRVDRDGRACARPLGPASCSWCVPRYGHEDASELEEGIALFAEHTRSEVRRAAARLVPDAAPADLLAAQLGVPREAFTVLPLPYVPRLRHRLPAGRLPTGAQPLRFGYFGRLAPHKGVGVLVAAFAALCRQGSPRPVELHVFGVADHDYERELRACAAGAPVSFHGAYGLADVAAADLHCAVFPTLAFETFGFVLDEAFELGLPVVVSDLGAISRRAGGAAVRVPPGDADALHRALRSLAADPARLVQLGAGLPPPAPSVEEHAAVLTAVYAAARTAPPAAVTSVDPRRRAAFVVKQRESALRRITPPGGPH